MKGPERARTVDESALLFDVLNEHLAQLEAGTAPDREALLARHPELRERLEACLDSLEFVHRTGAESRDATRGETVAEPPGETLGDYRLVREIGRGGMAVVYEAEQLSLARRVALKVLPFAAVLDPRQLQRFKNEAQAAAHLHHTNIVPVYSVGSERGVHYYAMQYIEGLSVAEIVAELRALEGRNGDGHGDGNGHGAAPEGRSASSSAALDAITKERSSRSASYCRSVARVGIQAAEALDHAHQQGVIHRDVKPANLMVDSAGELWITDFGLASFSSHPGLTTTGDIVGTVRYMSPEQALAKRAPVDHRTDVYSLGVTLYEFLTLELAYPGDDARAVIQDITFKDPPAVRSRNRAVPPELETILVKAMAKSPAERYETARAMAEDLERFLEDRPIRARRPTLLRRAGKWARRHRALVRAATVVMLVAVAALAVSTAWIWKERGRTQEAHDRAAGNLRLALRALDEVYLREGAERLLEARWRFFAREGVGLPPDWGRAETAAAFLEKGLAFYEELARRGGQDVEARTHVALAYRRVGTLRRRLGSFPDEAEAALRRAVVLLTELSSELDDAAVRFDLALTQGELAGLLHDRGRREESLRAGLAACAVLERLLAERTDERELRPCPASSDGATRLDVERPCASCLGYELVAVRLEMAWRLHEDRATTEAEAWFREALADAERLPGSNGGLLVAQACDSLGQLLAQTGRSALAEPYYRRGLTVAGELVKSDPDGPRGVRVAADLHLDLGQLLNERKETEAAVAALRRGIGLVERHPLAGRPVLRERLASLHEALGHVLLEAKKVDAAEAAYDRALELRQRLVGWFGDQPHYRLQLAKAHYHLFRLHYRFTDRLEEASGHVGHSLEIAGALAARNPDVPAVRFRLAQAKLGRGALRFTQKRLDEARADEDEARATLEDLVARYPEVRAYRQNLAVALHNSAKTLLQLERPDEAEARFRAAIEAWSGLLDTPECRFMAVATGANLVNLLLGAGRNQEAAREWERVLELRRALVEDFPENAGYVDDLVATLRPLADLHLELGEVDRAKERFAEILEQQPDTADVCHNLATLLATPLDPARRDPPEAVRLAERAVALEPENGAYRSVLGVARYRMDDLEAAERELRLAVRLLGEDDACDMLFLAMTTWRLGREEEARRWCDQADRAVVKRTAAEKAWLEAVRAEAAKLLEVGKEGD